MDESTFDRIGREELLHIEEALAEVDPDQVEITSTDGVLTLQLSDGARIVVNTHRAARQIWMAAVASAWHFDPPAQDNPDAGWATSEGTELRSTLRALIRDHAGIDLDI